ncbi:transporter substrate-binding domain-containing protein [Pseudaminobacter soli (ex Li et al. 2025)]|uniref:Amino acid ABC transporter substrate-binding protein n=1 Tax=Pseudaminobacter soli (ex Li et al. 2025) TaxID=1295366 RepID=A0A2P7SEN6_9HYPH|nr:transporter substrate-binding domain-containing protein [Mesorhizobium soli]PSJ60972.1 amino acid ABC transporter substrate-binding protein [Mesorhizobium soli]
MKRIVAAAAALGCVMAGVASAQAGETLDRVMKNKVLLEVTDQAYPPFSFMNDKGEMDGFDIDVAKEFAKRLGVEFKVETPSWAIITAGNWKGRWDICICSMTPTKERAEVLDFTNEYYAAPAVIVVNSDNTDIKTAADLNGKKLGAEAGTTYEKYIERQLVIDVPGVDPVKPEFPFADATAVPYDSEDTAFQDLALGSGKRLDAIVSGYLTAKERVEKSGGKFKIVGDTLYAEPIWVAVDKGDPEWDAKIKEIFTAMEADGTLAKISEKWVGKDISSKQ